MEAGRRRELTQKVPEVGDKNFGIFILIGFFCSFASRMKWSLFWFHVLVSMDYSLSKIFVYPVLAFEISIKNKLKELRQERTFLSRTSAYSTLRLEFFLARSGCKTFFLEKSLSLFNTFIFQDLVKPLAFWGINFYKKKKDFFWAFQKEKKINNKTFEMIKSCIVEKLNFSRFHFLLD